MTSISPRVFRFGGYIFAIMAVLAFVTPRTSSLAEDSQINGGGNNENKTYNLFLIGGRATANTLRQFVKLAGGTKANIVILTHASSLPDEKAGAEEAGTFRAIGVSKVTIITPGNANENLDPEATGIFICGGIQSNLVAMVPDKLRAQIVAYVKRGGLIGGTSAGSMAMVHIMITDGMNIKDLESRKGNEFCKGTLLFNDDGFAFLQDKLGKPRIVIETHRQTRPNRTFAAVAALGPQTIGLGLDEDTAMLLSVKDGEIVKPVKVFGVGQLCVVWRGPTFRTTIPPWKKQPTSAEMEKLSPQEQKDWDERTRTQNDPADVIDLRVSFISGSPLGNEYQLPTPDVVQNQVEAK